MKPFLIVFSLAITSFTMSAGSAIAADLAVDVSGVVEAKGEVYAAVYNREENWLRLNFAKTKVPAAVGTVRLTFAGLPPGEYAVTVFHDVNGNGKLDINVFGIPSEPTGSSNDAPAHFGPPRYAAARFALGAEAKTIAIKLN